MIPDRFFYPLIALLVAALIGLAMEWPQGEGERSWDRFGHQTVAERDAAANAAAQRAAALKPPPPPPPAPPPAINLK
jgi:hypothetical protein